MPSINTHYTGNLYFLHTGELLHSLKVVTFIISSITLQSSVNYFVLCTLHMYLMYSWVYKISGCNFASYITFILSIIIIAI